MPPKKKTPYTKKKAPAKKYMKRARPKVSRYLQGQGDTRDFLKITMHRQITKAQMLVNLSTGKKSVNLELHIYKVILN